MLPDRRSAPAKWAGRKTTSRVIPKPHFFGKAEKYGTAVPARLDRSTCQGEVETTGRGFEGSHHHHPQADSCFPPHPGKLPRKLYLEPLLPCVFLRAFRRYP